MKISITIAAAILRCAFASPLHAGVFERSLQGTMSMPMNVTGPESNPGTSTNDSLAGSVDLADRDPVEVENPDTTKSDDHDDTHNHSETSEDSEDDLTGDDSDDASSEDWNATATRSEDPVETSEDSEDSNDLTSEEPDDASSEDMDTATNDDPTETSEDSYVMTGDNQTLSNLVGASSQYKASTTISAKALSPASKAIFHGMASVAVLVSAIALY